MTMLTRMETEFQMVVILVIMMAIRAFKSVRRQLL